MFDSLWCLPFIDVEKKCKAVCVHYFKVDTFYATCGCHSQVKKSNIFQCCFCVIVKQENTNDTEETHKKHFVAQRGARTHDPEIKSLMLYRLS